MKVQLQNALLVLLCVLCLLASCTEAHKPAVDTESENGMDTSAVETDVHDTTETEATSDDDTDIVTISAGDHIFAYVYRTYYESSGKTVYQLSAAPLDPLPEDTALDHVLRGTDDADRCAGTVYDYQSIKRYLIRSDGNIYIYTPKTRESVGVFFYPAYHYEDKELIYITDVVTCEPAALFVWDSYYQGYRVYSFARKDFLTEEMHDGFDTVAADGKILVYDKIKDKNASEDSDPIMKNTLISLYSGEDLATHIEQEPRYQMHLLASPDGKTQYYQSCVLYTSNTDHRGQLYTADFVPFGSKSAEDPIVVSSGDLYCTVDSKIHCYAPDGTEKELPESPYFDHVLQLFCDYAVVLGEDGFVHVTDLDGNLLRTVCEWQDGWRYHKALSSWKDGNALFKAGLYLIFSNNKEDKTYEFGYIPGETELYYAEYDQSPAYAKPVLYLYPKETCEVHVILEQAERLTVSYPRYLAENGWTVTAQPDGTLSDGNRSYYCLYWEEDCTYDATFNKGFCVAGADSAAFLEEALAKLGLSEREANEFIIYWLPILEESPYNCIYFECTEERQEKSPLLISPVPDTLIRIAMHILPCDAYVSLPTQTLAAPAREGFCAVEWGGVVYDKKS